MKTLTNCSALFKPSSCASTNRTTSIINPMKSYLITEYKPQSKPQLSIQQQKEGIKHHHHHCQTNIISFTSSTNNNNNNVSSSSYNKFHYKVYEHAIDALFTFLKETLHNDVYTMIKQVFCNEISKAYDLYYEYIYNITNSFMCYKYSSSIGKMLSKLNVNYTTCCGSGSKSNNKKNLKMSYDFYKKNVNGYNCNNTEKQQCKQYSLYTLTKNKKLFKNKAQSISQSKSNSQDNKKQSNFVLNIKLYNKLNKNKKHKTDIYYTTTTTNNNNGNTNNTKIRNNKVKYTFNNNNNTTIIPNVNTKLSRNNHSNCSLFYFHNNNNMNSTSSQSNKHYIDNNFKGVAYKTKQKQNSNKQSTSHYNYNTFSHLHFPSESTYSVRKSIKLPNNNKNHKNTNSNNNINNNNRIVNVSTNINEKQTSEQLKEIKSNLDEHLKVMFNFSYEGFLNKESESVSKKSLFDVSTSPMENNNHSTLL